MTDHVGEARDRVWMLRNGKARNIQSFVLMTPDGQVFVDIDMDQPLQPQLDAASERLGL